MSCQQISRAPVIFLVLTLATAGCIESLTGRTKFHAAVENYSGADIPVRMSLTDNSTGKTTEIEFGIVSSFSNQETTLSAGDYFIRVSAGEVKVERDWRLDPGNDGLTLRISNSTVEFVRVK